ncbi:MAG: hypothetical protein ACD_12C00655G0001 [uncultured bacterium]|nr:MAG: hypothetical protein ACD_12C00655G0001 [uncultured bacterium]
MSKIYQKPVVAMWTKARESEWPPNMYLFLPLLSKTGIEVASLNLEVTTEKDLYQKYQSLLAGLLGKELTVGVISSRGKPNLSHQTITTGGGILSKSSLSNNYTQLTNEQFSQIVKEPMPRISFVS